MPNAPTCAPVNDGLRNRPSGSIGCATRASIATNATSSAPAPAYTTIPFERSSA